MVDVAREVDRHGLSSSVRERFLCRSARREAAVSKSCHHKSVVREILSSSERFSSRRQASAFRQAPFVTLTFPVRGGTSRRSRSRVQLGCLLSPFPSRGLEEAPRVPPAHRRLTPGLTWGGYRTLVSRYHPRPQLARALNSQLSHSRAGASSIVPERTLPKSPYLLILARMSVTRGRRGGSVPPNTHSGCRGPGY